MVVVESLDSDSEPEVDEEEVRQKRQREADYRGFRQEFDRIKRDYAGKEADSEKLKKQGNNFFAVGCYSQAAMIYTEAIDLQPDNAVLYCNRAMAYLKQGMPEKALEDADLSLKIDFRVENIKAYWRKAQALLDLQREEESEAVADEGLALQPGNNHLNVVRRKAREAVHLRRLSAHDWLCKTQGVEKRFSFTTVGIMTMSIFGQDVAATFDLSVEGYPRSLVVRMVPEGDVRGTGPPPPDMPYIYEFHESEQGDEELWMCHPVGTRDLPTKFEGPGFDRLKKAPKVNANAMEGTLDEKCEKYIAAMSDILPLMPSQLPEEPSDKQIKREVKMTDKLSKLKLKYGLDVHLRAVELAKDPSSAPSPALEELARGLHHRFIARKIIPMPKEDANTDTAPAGGAKVTSGGAKSTASVSCLSSIVSRLCKGTA